MVCKRTIQLVLADTTRVRAAHPPVVKVLAVHCLCTYPLWHQGSSDVPLKWHCQLVLTNTSTLFFLKILKSSKVNESFGQISTRYSTSTYGLVAHIPENRSKSRPENVRCLGSGEVLMKQEQTLSTSMQGNCFSVDVPTFWFPGFFPAHSERREEPWWRFVWPPSWRTMMTTWRKDLGRLLCLLHAFGLSCAGVSGTRVGALLRVYHRASTRDAHVMSSFSDHTKITLALSSIYACSHPISASSPCPLSPLLPPARQLILSALRHVVVRLGWLCVSW